MAYYFASDVHLGLRLDGNDPGNEENFIAWLDKIAGDAEGIFLVGDIFDFWFEYKNAIPEGHERVLDKFRELTSRGIKVRFFGGNHDMWTMKYFDHECGMESYDKGIIFDLHGKKTYVAHGDNVGHTRLGERLLQAIFRCKPAQWLFRAIVPSRTAYRFGNWWSRGSRMKGNTKYEFRKEAEPIVKFARKFIKKNGVDYMVFGHLHSSAEYKLNEKTTLFILGEWIYDETPVYGIFTGDGFKLEKFIR